MTNVTNHHPAVAEIRAQTETWLKAVRAKDLQGITAYYAPDIVAFDAIEQLQFKGKDAYEQHWAKCLTMCQGSLSFEFGEFTIVADETLAFAHALCRCGGSNEQGEEQAGWMRVSLGYRKQHGQWWVVHEHYSAPFEMESGKALFDLLP